MKYLILFLTLLLSSVLVSASEDASITLKKVFVKFDNHQFEGKPFSNKNMDNAGLILNSNEIVGTLYIIKEDEMEYRLPVKARFDGIGVVAFAKLADTSSEFGIRGLAGNPISDIFDQTFYGYRAGAYLTGGFSYDIAVNLNGLLLHDVGLGFGAGVDIEYLKIDLLPLDQQKYQQIKNIILE